MTILCVGKNYAKHADEMGDGRPTEPIWFLKPDSSIASNWVEIPDGIGEVHHEVELALRIGENGKISALTVALDMTARDLQTKAKNAGKPWTQAKGFDTFLPLGEWVTARGVDLQNLRLRCWVNDQIRQDGNTSEMTWSVPELLEEARKWITLRAGDILLTGTPHGVGPVVSGDTIRAEIQHHVELEVQVTKR